MVSTCSRIISLSKNWAPFLATNCAVSLTMSLRRGRGDRRGGRKREEEERGERRGGRKREEGEGGEGMREEIEGEEGKEGEGEGEGGEGEEGTDKE